MKRYISSIIIVAVLLLMLGTYYIYAEVSGSPFPHFKIEKVSGNEKEIGSLHITGGYGPGNIHENFDLSLNGTVYSSERSFLDKLDYTSNKIKELRKKYRSFMRGKMGENLFYEDQDWLIYSDTPSNWNNSTSTNNQFLEISMLKKKDKKITNFQVPLSKQNRYVRVDNIQLVGKQLKIATENIVGLNETEFNEVHVYTVDTSNHRLVHDETIQVVNSRTQNEYTNIQNIQNSDVSVPSKYVLYNVSLMKRTDQGSDQVLKSELIAYNIETSEKEIIKLPKNMNIEDLNSFLGDDIYLITSNPNELNITAYNFKNQHVENVLSIKDQNIFIDKMAYTIKNGRLYIVTTHINEKTVGKIEIYDVKTGKNLFQGKIINSEIEKNIEDSSLSFYGFE